jgi:hypothetical protein
MKPGDVVRDDLTNREAVIEKVFGRFVLLKDVEWLGGVRYSWEVTTPEELNVPEEPYEYECPNCGHKTVCYFCEGE